MESGNEFGNVDPRNDELPKPKSRRISVFWVSFIITILILAIIYSFALYNAAQKNSAQASPNLRIEDAASLRVENDKIVVSGKLAETVVQNFSEHLSKIDQELTVTSVQDINPVIEREVDNAFAQVYQQIPEYLGYYYSLKGEYSEIAKALGANSDSATESILFKKAHFDESLEQALSRIKSDAEVTLGVAEQNLDAHAKNNLGLDSSQLVIVKTTLQLSLDNLKDKFAAHIKNMLSVGTGKVGIVGIGKIASKTISEKVATKVLAKLSVKAAAKVGGVSGGAAAGAGVGAIGGPIGAAVGGIVGAAAAWIATDKIILEADKYLNQEEFQRDITNSLNIQKRDVNTLLKTTYASIFNDLAITQKQALKEGVVVKSAQK